MARSKPIAEELEERLLDRQQTGAAWESVERTRDTWLSDLERATEAYAYEYVAPAASRRVILKFMELGFSLENIGGGDTVWRRELVRSINRTKPDMIIDVIGPDDELVTDLNKRATISIDLGTGEGIYFIVRDVGLFLDTLENFNVYDLVRKTKARKTKTRKRNPNPPRRKSKAARRVDLLEGGGCPPRHGHPRRFTATRAQLRRALSRYADFGGAKISEIVHSVDPGLDIGSGGAYPMRLCFADLYDLPDLERRLRQIAHEDPDGLWVLLQDNPTSTQDAKLARRLSNPG